MMPASALGLPLRAQFPRLAAEPQLCYLDSAATAQKPEAVIAAVADAWRRLAAPVHRGLYPEAEAASEAYEGARAALARFIGAAPDEVVFTRSATDAINQVAAGWARPRLAPGERIVVTGMEHHSNLLPWQRVCRETGAALVTVPVGADGSADWPEDDVLFGGGTRLLALTWVSNVLGTVNPVAELARRAHARGVAVLVDAAQAVAHFPADVAALDCDFLAFSAHKMYGPDGIGLLYVRRERQAELEPALLGGGMVDEVGATESTWLPAPARYEAGSPNLAGALGFAAAARFVQALGLPALGAHGRELAGLALAALADIPGIELYGPRDPADRGALVSFNLAGVHPHDLAQVAGEQGVALRAGHHCCQPLMQRLGVSATVRASFAAYSAAEDIPRLRAAVLAARKRFG